MHNFDIHSDAERNWDAEAQRILDKVKWRYVASQIRDESAQETGGPVDTTRRARDTEDPGFYTEHLFTEEDVIGPLIFYGADHAGRPKYMRWYDESKEYLLDEQAFIGVNSLVDTILKKRDIGIHVARSTIQDALCSWIRERTSNPSEHDFVATFCSEVGELVREVEVWAPIQNLVNEKPFTLGRIAFRRLEASLVDEWEEQSIARWPEASQQLREMFCLKVRKTQGYCAAVLRVTAEPAKAYELLLEEGERSLHFLLLFTGAGLDAAATSPCALWGKGQVDQSHIYQVSDGEFIGVQQSILQPESPPVGLHAAGIDRAFELGLQKLHEIMVADSRSDFEENCLRAIELYSRCTVAKGLVSKLLVMLPALESILLRDASEPIVHYLGERMAFMVAKEPQDRLRVLDTVKQVYRVRSQYIHHGIPVTNVGVVTQFMGDALYAIINLLRSSNQVRTRKGLLDELDEMRMK